MTSVHVQSVIKTGSFKRATFLSAAGLVIAWYYEVEKTIGDCRCTNWIGYILFWLTFTTIVLYYLYVIRKVSKSHVMNPVFPDLPVRRKSVFDIEPHQALVDLRVALSSHTTKSITTIPASIKRRASDVYSALRQAPPIVAMASRPTFRQAATMKSLGTRRRRVSILDPKKSEASLHLTQLNSPSKDMKMFCDDESSTTRSTDGDSLSDTFDNDMCWEVSSTPDPCATSLITCNSIDVQMGNPAEVISALSLLLLIAFVVATSQVYGFGLALFVGFFTGIGICNSAEVFKLIYGPVTLRWIIALAIYHSLNMPQLALSPTFPLV